MFLEQSCVRLNVPLDIDGEIIPPNTVFRFAGINKDGRVVISKLEDETEGYIVYPEMVRQCKPEFVTNSDGEIPEQTEE